MAEFKRYLKYGVFKWTDAEKYLTKQELESFSSFLLQIRNGRFRDGKKLHDYVVVNQEMPYAGQVWKLIQEHWEQAEIKRQEGK